MTKLKGLKLLIIDDEPHLRLMLSDFFQDEGALTSTAPDGDAGLARLRDWCPDVVLVDLNMPRLDGLGFIAQAVGEAPEIPIIVITGTGMAVEVDMAIRLGAWDVVQKPIRDLSFLHRLIEGSLRSSSKQAATTSSPRPD